MSEPRTRTLLVIGLLLVLALASLGLTAYFFLHAAIRADTQAQLHAITTLKADQIRTWLDERQRNLEALARGPLFVRRLREEFAAGRAEGTGALPDWQQRLELARELYPFQSILLLNEAGQVLVGTGLREPPADWATLETASRTPGVHLQDFTRVPGADPERIELGVYTRLTLDPPAPPLVLYGRLDPQVFLYPLLQQWPTASPSAETLLVRRDGDQVVFLNELRHRAGTALRLRLPLSEAALPAAQILRGQSGIFEGIDYRGERVLAALMLIPGTAWAMVSKLDLREAFATLNELTVIAVAIIGGTLLLVGIAFLLWRRSEEQARRAITLEQDLAYQRLAQRFGYLSQHANDAILLADAERRIEEVNERALAQYGYPRENLQGRRLDDLLAVDEQARLVPEWEQWRPAHPASTRPCIAARTVRPSPSSAVCAASSRMAAWSIWTSCATSPNGGARRMPCAPRRRFRRASCTTSPRAW